VRQSIYGGLVLAAIGWGFATASPAAIGGGFVLGGFFDLKSRREEGWLGERFAEYAAYRTRTRKLIPWVY
jgi:protein-S-isoprenylcysteine O-methyltransferase Ste14